MNYILIYPDELRAESLRCYGHPLIQTPNIDALASEGTLFEQNYSAHPVCVASRCSLVTGWHPHVHGYRSQPHLMPDTEENFIKYLNQAGWTTALIGKDDCFDQASTGRLFTEYRHYPPKHRSAADGKKHYTMIMPPTPDSEESQHCDAIFAADAADFIHRHKNDTNPFFLWVNFLLPHPPYTCPESFYNMYDSDAITGLRSDEWIKGKPSLYALSRKYREADAEAPETYKKMNAIYLGMISYVDMLVGRIVNALKEAGIYEETTIILCSDHGDFAGDASLTEKFPNALDDMLTHVPLIIRRPGEKKNHRVSALTQSIDIFPTIFDFENLSADYDQFGISLKPQVQGACGDKNRAVYSEGGYDTREPQCFETRGPEGSVKRRVMGEGTIYYPKMLQQDLNPDSVCRAIMRRDAQYKIIIRTSGEHELYDMTNDPQEYYNLAGEAGYKDIFNDLAMKTLIWLLHTSDVTPHPSPDDLPWYAREESGLK